MNYEQTLSAYRFYSGHKKATSSEMASSLGLYVKRWQRWAAAGLQGIKLNAVYEQNLDQQVPSQIER